MGIDIFLYKAVTPKSSEKYAQNAEEVKDEAVAFPFGSLNSAFMSSGLFEYQDGFYPDPYYSQHQDSETYCRPRDFEESRRWIKSNLSKEHQSEFLDLMDRMESDESLWLWFGPP